MTEIQEPSKKAESYKNRCQDTDHTDDSNSSSSESSSGTEDEDIADLTESECGRRIQLFEEEMEELQERIRSVNDIINKEKKIIIEMEFKEVHSGTHPEYFKRLSELDNEKKMRLQVAETSRVLKNRSIMIQVDAETLSLQQEYMEKVKALFERIRDEIEEKVVDLEEEHYNKYENVDKWLSERSSFDKGSRKQSSRHHKHVFELSVPKRKPVTVLGPCIVYRASKSEIMEDLTLIKKAATEKRRRLRKLICRQRFEKEFDIKPTFTPKLPDFLLDRVSAELETAEDV